MDISPEVTIAAWPASGACSEGCAAVNRAHRRYGARRPVRASGRDLRPEELHLRDLMDLDLDSESAIEDFCASYGPLVLYDVQRRERALERLHWTPPEVEV